MINIDRMCEDLEACVNKNAYGKPETIDINKLKQGGYTVRCAGLIVAAAKAQGVTVHNGSNTIWRQYLTESGYITNGKPSENYPHKTNGLSSSQLEKGMMVFKWSSVGCSNPQHEKDGKGNYQHIGVVTSVKPLRIVHASSTAGKVTVDTAIGKWCAWGRLKGVDYGNHEATMNTETQQEGVSTMYGTLKILVGLNLRQGKGTNYNRILTIPAGTQVDYMGDIKQDAWLLVAYNGNTGYVKNETRYVKMIKPCAAEEPVVEDTVVEEIAVPEEEDQWPEDGHADDTKLTLEERVAVLEESVSCLWARIERMGG